MKTINMTLRLPQEQADQLELIASVNGKPMSEEIREALADHTRRQLQDPAFRDRLKDSRARQDRLASELD